MSEAVVVALIVGVVGPVVLAYFKRRLDAIDRAQAETAEIQAITHDLVNSNMSAALDGEMNARVRELATMREMVALRQGLGQEPTADTLAAIRSTELEIDRLRTTIADRG